METKSIKISCKSFFGDVHEKVVLFIFSLLCNDIGSLLFLLFFLLPCSAVAQVFRGALHNVHKPKNQSALG